VRREAQTNKHPEKEMRFVGRLEKTLTIGMGAIRREDLL